MSTTNPNLIHSHKEILYFPKGGQPTLAPNEWQTWGGDQDEGGLPDLEHGAHKVLVPFFGGSNTIKNKTF